MKAKIVELLTNNPGLKGKEIARKLSLEKKSVNSFLYHDKSGTFIERKNEWFLANIGAVLRFEKSGWLTTCDFEALLKEGSDVWCDSIETVRFEFYNCSILLGAISRLLSLVNQLASIGKHVTLDFTGCKKSFSYLCRIGLFETFHESVTVLPQIKDSSSYYGGNNKVMEFVLIPAETQQTNLPVKLKNSFIELAGEQHSNAAFGFIAEFINNIIEHSQTPTPGVAALQVYGKSKNRTKVQTVFSDSGKGIIGTLRPVLAKRYPQLHNKYPPNKENSDIHLLNEVLQSGGVSGANDANYLGRGLGLKLSAKQAAKFDATICVRQETFELTLKYVDGKLDESSYSSDLKKISGTHICFDFFLR
ncbi:hypothetical protein [Pseudoalteromonas prydzensis]|uniref:hypothetical protein n=1 Tax=Pseudoalteromonas prydzensis TaxID=182141 RepID=UPI0007E5174B|nr:hypothetical protein [Pseudoalteromonas prydzensis]MBE0377779.1 hypothetical protein [Pseudoalteromonas prydzensis ACAM 620]